MVLIVFATLLILGIAFFQTIQGCFGAMIMAILTVLTAAVALNFYEPMGGLLAGRLGAVADPVALLAIFVIVLLALRIAFDRLIRGNVVLGLWPDRIGGAAFGMVTAMIMTGMFMIIVQMLPMPASILYWQPYDSGLGVKHGGPPRWATNFTLATAGQLSDGPLRAIMSEKKFSSLHDNLPLESFCLRNRKPGARVSTPTDALEITAAHIVQIPDKERFGELSAADRARLKKGIPEIQDTAPPYPLLSGQEKDDTKVLVIRASIDESARNEEDNWWRLPATHFRLVCKSGRSFYPVGYLTYTAGWRVNTSISDKLITQIGDIHVARQWRSKSTNKLIVDWLYRIPDDQMPEYVVFRRTARAPLPPVTKGLPKVFGKHTQLALSVKAVHSRVKLESAGTGRRLFRPEIVELKGQLPDGIQIRYKKDAVPVPIKQIQVTRGKLRNTVIIGATAKLKSSKERGDVSVSGLDLPEQNDILLQVQCKIDPEFRDSSILGNLKPRLLLSTGEEVRHIGAYLFYKSGEKKHVHFYYDFSSSKGRLDADFVQTFGNNLAKAETFGLIFSVPASESTSVVGLTFDAGPAYEFRTAAPLACSRRR